jgi:hypothetical protein
MNGGELKIDDSTFESNTAPTVRHSEAFSREISLNFRSNSRRATCTTYRGVLFMFKLVMFWRSTTHHSLATLPAL